MDENLARLNRIYPNCGYVAIPPYRPELFEGRVYDSSFDTKAAMNRWNSKPLSYEEAQEWVSKGNRIGWVVPKGYVVVDIDNKDDERSQEYLERLLEKFEVKYSYNYTSKGIHLLFKDPSELIKSDSRTKCGLNIEIDTRANKTGYIILPSNDPHRSWGEWNDFVEDIPYFLKPLLKDNTMSFIGMKDGDGRNNALFKWRSQLERCQKLNSKEIEKTIRIINENLFDTPMPNNELFKTVLKQRDKEEKNVDVRKENVYDRLAEEIISKYDIISYGSKFYKFNGIYYKYMSDVDLDRIIHFEISRNVGKTGRAEIRDFVKIKTQVSVNEFDKDWHKIACKNGILNLVTAELEEPNKSDINTIFIPFEYSKDPAYSPRIDNFMKEITGGDVTKMQFLYQIAGYCLLKKNLFEKFFLFKGEGGTGKSTFMNLLYKLVGGDVNCSHASLDNLDNDYYLSTMIGKLLNIDDDVVDGKTLENTGRFKSIVSGNIISVRQIYKEVVDFVPYVTLVFSCNRLPRLMDKTSGLYRRMVLIELNNKVEHPDPLFINKVTDNNMQYFLFKAVQGITLAIEEGRFRIMQSERQLLEMFKRRQSALNEWLYENDITVGDLYNNKCSILYAQFIEWCTNNGYAKRPNAFTFKEDISALYQMEIKMVASDKEGIPVQVFTKRGDFDSSFKPF